MSKNMIFSKHNIFSKIKDSEKYFIVNCLTGNADVLSKNEGEELADWIEKSNNQQTKLIKELIASDYIIDEEEENKLYRSKYLDFIDTRDEDEIQLFFVPNYSCNFACSYCYQDEYTQVKSDLTKEIIDSFFLYINKEFAGRKKYITIFGGEPLLGSEKQKETIQYFIEKSNSYNLEICIVSNGYTLTEYLPILKNAKVREIQLTLDGTADMHDSRRFLKGGAGSFEKIVYGIDACLQNKIMINLRTVIDRENIENLPELAEFATKKGWTSSRFFKTQIGRNYELHHCQSNANILLSRIEMYEQLYEICKKYPFILDFYKPAYSLSKFLSENKALPDPLFDSCPACKTEWAFDYTGHIYPCTATVGKAGESLGTFYPVVIKNDLKISEWEKRDVTEIPECQLCNVQLACGGGCGSVAKNKKGSIFSPDCRPVKELLELGMAQYFK